MDYHFQANAHAATITADCVVVGVYANGQLSKAAQQIDTASQGALQQHLALGDFKGKKEQSCLLYQIANIAAPRVLLMGLGDTDKLTHSNLLAVIQTAANQLKKANIQRIACFLSDEVNQDQALLTRLSIGSVATALYQFSGYKSKADPLSSITDWVVAHTDSTDYRDAVAQGYAIAVGTDLARELGDLPPNICTPTYLATTATQLATESANVSVEVLEEADMEKLGMGSFLSVSKGSDQAGKMIILQYQGAEADTAPVALVGKGITFDTGGISLKPGAAMDEMKYDMCGAASVLGAFKACVTMALPINVVAVLAAAENMPSGKASKPADIVTSMSGKTIEILNTDAEGRLVLCDALTYVERFKPTAVIDVATLTGACITALGRHTSGLLSNDDALAEAVFQAGQEADDATWRLPLGEKYQEQLKSNFADLANIGGPAGGTITAACFLARFTESYPWAHLDIAGIAWHSGNNKGATGRPVPLLTQWLITRARG